MNHSRTGLDLLFKVLPVFSVPVISLNRYCANLRISRLHLFLQLIFAPQEGVVVLGEGSTSGEALALGFQEQKQKKGRNPRGDS